MRLPARIEYELGWMALSVLFGISYLTAVPSPAVKALLPGWFFIVWAIGLLVSGTGGIVGTVLGTVLRARRRYWGLSLERISIRLQVGLVASLGVATLYVWSRSSHMPFPAVGVSLVVVWITINVVRDLGIGAELRNLPTAEE